MGSGDGGIWERIDAVNTESQQYRSEPVSFNKSFINRFHTIMYECDSVLASAIGNRLFFTDVYVLPV